MRQVSRILPRVGWTAAAMLTSILSLAAWAQDAKKANPRDSELPAKKRQALASLRKELPAKSEYYSYTSSDLDAGLNVELRKLGRVPAEPADDEIFVRRVCLDLTGKLPTPKMVREFAASDDPKKRSDLINQLLESEAWARKWARYWRDVILFNNTTDRRRYNAQWLEDWLFDQFKKDRGWDQIAAELVMADGKRTEERRDNFLLAQDGSATQMASETARIFMGINIQCAECHDHPFDQWKREQFHQLAAFFSNGKYFMPDARDPAKKTETKLKYPNIGSVVAQELGESAAELPNFVSVGDTVGPGFLGIQAAPFVVNSPGDLPANVAVQVSKERLNRRLELLKAQNADLGNSGAAEIAASQQGLYDQAARMVLSPKLKAFDLKNESDKVRDAYGRNGFGQGLLMARRLVEAGVPFIEVRRGGWDNHNDLWKNVPRNAREVDPALAQLIRDLKSRGMLGSTLVVCTGEFGRTPKVNNKGGRDHYPKAFSALVAGSGIKGGRAIGKTNDIGTEVAERPVTVPDLFQTFCKALKLNPATEMVTPQGRPVKIVDEGKPVGELFV